MITDNNRWWQTSILASFTHSPNLSKLSLCKGDAGIIISEEYKGEENFEWILNLSDSEKWVLKKCCFENEEKHWIHKPVCDISNQEQPVSFPEQIQDSQMMFFFQEQSIKCADWKSDLFQEQFIKCLNCENIVFQDQCIKCGNCQTCKTRSSLPWRDRDHLCQKYAQTPG